MGPMIEKLPELAIAGAGAHRIWIRLEPVRHVTSARRGPHLAEAFDAVALTGVDFNGSHDDGLARFEARVYAPPGFEDSDRDRCVLANFEFHHVVLNSAQSGRMDFTGVLVGALAYRQEVYDRIASGTPLLEVPEILDQWKESVRYLPVPHPELQQFLGWRARIIMAPLHESDQDN
jgi:hypothetical protein